MYKLVILALALATPALADTQVVKTGNVYPYVADAAVLKPASLYPSSYGYAAAPAAYGYAAAPAAYGYAAAPAAYGYVAPAVSGYAVPQYHQYAQYPAASVAYPAGYGYNSYVAPAPVHQVPASTYPAYGAQYVVPKTVL